MRILHVISGLDPRAGGTVTAVVGLATAQARAGLDVAVLSTHSAGASRVNLDLLEQHGVKAQSVGPVTGPLQRHHELAKTTDGIVAAADVVHIHALWEEVQHQAARAAMRRGVPYVITPHGMLDPWSLSQSKWKKRIYLLWRLRKNLRGAAALHFTAAAERDLTAPLRLGVPAIVEPNGIDLAEFSELPAKGGFRARHPQIGARPLVLFLSRLHPKKGLDLLIPAFAQGTTDAVLVIAGPDSNGYQATVAAMVAEHGIGQRVIFPGMLVGREKIEAMVDADVFVLPSYQENFGIVVAESLAAGTPVIISDQVNIHAEISAAGVGRVVPTKVEPLAGHLRQWLAGDSLRHNAAEKARAFVWQHYDWQRIAERWGGHYREIKARH